MNIVQRAQRFFSSLNTKSSDAYGANLLSIFLGKVSQDDYYQGLVFSCVDVIAKTASAIPFVLVKKQKDDRSLVLDDDDQIIESHPIIDLLEQPNQRHTWTTFSYLLYSYLALHGESYLVPNASMAGNKILELLPLNPLNVAIERGLTNYQPILKYKYTGNGCYKEFTPDQIVPIIQPNPYDDLRGVSPILMAANDIKSEILAKRWNAKFYENGGSPSGIFKIGTNDTTAFKQIESIIKEKYQGIDNAFKMFILNKDSDFKNITPTQKDMDFVQQLQLSEKRIHKIFKVPDILLGETDAAKYSNAEIAKRIFAETVIQPMLTIAFDSLNHFLLPKMGDDSVVLKFHNPVSEDRNVEILEREQDRKEMETSFRFMTVNEMRAQFALKPLPDGDVLVVQGGVSGFGSYTEPTPPTTPTKMLEEKKAQKAAYQELKKLRDAYIRRQRKPYTAQVDATFKELISAMKKKDVTDLTKKGKGKKKDYTYDDVDELADEIIPESEAKKFGEKLLSVLITFGFLSIVQGVDDTAKVYHMTNKPDLNGDLDKWLKERGQSTSESARDDLLERAREVIKQQIDAGVVDKAKLKDEVISIFEGEDGWRADRIVRTELTSAYMNGNYETALENGMSEKAWIVYGDNPCETCTGNADAGWIGIEQSFPDGSDVAGAHPNCQCSVDYKSELTPNLT